MDMYWPCSGIAGGSSTGCLLVVVLEKSSHNLSVVLEFRR